MIMLSNATYTGVRRAQRGRLVARDRDDLLRDDLGFTGVTITDSLDGTATGPRALDQRRWPSARRGPGPT